MTSQYPMRDGSGKLLVSVDYEIAYTAGYVLPVTRNLEDFVIDESVGSWYIWTQPNPTLVEDLDSMEAVEIQVAIPNHSLKPGSRIEVAPNFPLRCSDGSTATTHIAYALNSQEAKDYIASKYGSRGEEALEQAVARGTMFYLP